jgi:hypothetical protein
MAVPTKGEVRSQRTFIKYCGLSPIGDHRSSRAFLYKNLGTCTCPQQRRRYRLPRGLRRNSAAQMMRCDEVRRIHFSVKSFFNVLIVHCSSIQHNDMTQAGADETGLMAWQRLALPRRHGTRSRWCRSIDPGAEPSAESSRCRCHDLKCRSQL